MIDLAVQKAIRARLLATAAVTALVPPLRSSTETTRPAPSPSIILGETQVIDAGTSVQRKHSRVYHTVHVWKREPSLQGVKEISGEIRTAIHSGRLDLDSGLHCADAKVTSIRAIRDPDGETSHGIVTVEVLVNEVAA